MSNSDSIEDTTKKRSATLSSVISADSCGVSEAAFAAGRLTLSANPGANLKSIINTGSAVKAAPNAVSSEQPLASTYNPLLALATLVAAERLQPIPDEIPNPGDQNQTPTCSTISTNGTSAKLNQTSKIPSPTEKRGLYTPSTINTNGNSVKMTQTSKIPPPTKKRKLYTPSTLNTTNNSCNGTQTSKIPPPAKKRGLSKNWMTGESSDEESHWRDKLNNGRIIEAPWNKNYQVLVKYYRMHGDSNVPRSYPNKQLSGWVKRQRNNLKDGKLSPVKISLLNNLDFVWNRTDGQWYKKFCDLVRFQQKFGHCYVTAKYDRSLAEWTQRQRREYKNRRAKIPQDRLQKLEALEGWSWDKLKWNDKGERAPEVDG